MFTDTDNITLGVMLRKIQDETAVTRVSCMRDESERPSSFGSALCYSVMYISKIIFIRSLEFNLGLQNCNPETKRVVEHIESTLICL